ncbi:MAG: 16S rRNA (adenine(1518)-N(6)/adenine(1519)-N(6))-dimethyltransferase RsmA [Clostridia bacterium]|nr:16S rRNA (adenine(1518)-N(6)/adenine(1519)-N(6))-dimethyltransferase RsmA [Clostridia bacterium]
MNLTDASEIRALLSRHSFRFSKSMGQNFLIAPWVPEKIAESAGLAADTGVLEVGPGIGSLTARLAERAGKVVAVELDRNLAPVLQETLLGLPNVEIIFGDALKIDLCKLVDERMGGFRPVVCANLPYNVTSPILSAFIDAHCFESITVMVQREVARRLCAGAGTSEYGAFTIYVNWNCEAEILFDVPPDCFMPRPKVTSSVIRLFPRSVPPVQVSDEKLMFRIVRASFNQRRKTLQNALSNGLSDFSKERISTAIEACGLDPLIRGEVLDISAFAALANELSG